MRRFFPALFALLLSAAPLSAWDYAGHRTVNLLALEALPADFPAFVKTPEARERITFLAGEPDRWRNSKDGALRHLNDPDHYLDYEELLDAGLSADTVSDFRYLFAHQWLAARAAHSSAFAPIDPAKNWDHTREFAGMLPWAITEAYARLRSEFSYLKAYEQLGTPAEIANARANVIQQMGVMGHYAGDGAQPLHVTKSYNGWVGDNPRGFTTARTIHATIDGDFMNASGGIDPAALVPRIQPATTISLAPAADKRAPVFVAAFNYILAQNARVVPLYELEKAGAFSGAGAEQTRAGRAFIETQFVTGAQMLASLWLTAWREAPTDDYTIRVLTERKARAAAKP